jgi:hypothetical protein
VDVGRRDKSSRCCLSVWVLALRRDWKCQVKYTLTYQELSSRANGANYFSEPLMTRAGQARESDCRSRERESGMLVWPSTTAALLFTTTTTTPSSDLTYDKLSFIFSSSCHSVTLLSSDSFSVCYRSLSPSLLSSFLRPQLIASHCLTPSPTSYPKFLHTLQHGFQCPPSP